MGFAPYTLFDFQQGLDKSKQDWIIPEGAMAALWDGYVHQGVLQSREGYSPYADGGKGGAPYCESRMVSRITAQATGVNSSTTDTGDITLEAPLRRGTIQLITASETLTDDGEGGWTSTAGGSPTGSIDYTTGLISDTVFVSSNGEAITATYDFHPGNPVMMLATYITENNVKQLIVADTEYVNRFNSTTNRLDDITQTLSITATSNTTPVQVTTSSSHFLYDNNKVYIYNTGIAALDNNEWVVTKVDATNFTLNGSTAPGGTSSTGTAKKIFSGGASDFFHWENYPDKDNNNRLLFTNNVDPIQAYSGSSINAYEADADFDFKDSGGSNNVQNLRCLRLHFVKDRLILLRVTWRDTNSSTTVALPRGMRISGFGASADVFNAGTSGAGEINIPDRFWIFSSTQNRDELLIFTEQKTWDLYYTGNDTVPFALKLIDSTRGGDAPMGTYTYLERTLTASKRGLVITDGYNVQEADELIPDFVFDDIDNELFARVFAGAEDKDRNHYLIYPSIYAKENNSESDEILVINFEEGNLAKFDLPLSCMGQYEEFFQTLWSDLTEENVGDWAGWTEIYKTWAGNAYSKNVVRTLGGGHNGEVVRLNANESVDNLVRIRGATNSANCVLTTDFNTFAVGDRVYITAVNGMTGLNGVVDEVSAVTDYTITLGNTDTTDTDKWGVYTSGGHVSKIIPFEFVTKKFNPFFKEGKRVLMGWAQSYFSTVETQAYEEFIAISDASQDSVDDPVVITTPDLHGYSEGDEVFIRGVSGMTELNDETYTVTNPTPFTFELFGTAGGTFTDYTSGGYVKRRKHAMLYLDILSNDTSDLTQDKAFSGRTVGIRLDNRSGVTQDKMWKKTLLAQNGNNIQLRFHVEDPVPKVRIHSVMLGMKPAGRLRDS